MIIKTFKVRDGKKWSVLWDNATQVQHYKISRSDLEERYPNLLESFKGFNLKDHLRNWNDAVRVVSWNDARDGSPHCLLTQNSCFVMNDEGQTLERV